MHKFQCVKYFAIKDLCYEEMVKIKNVEHRIIIGWIRWKMKLRVLLYDKSIPTRFKKSAIR